MNFLEMAHFNHDQAIQEQRIRDKKYIADEIARRDRALIENSEMCKAIILDAKQYEEETKLKIQTFEENARQLEAILHDRDVEIYGLKTILSNKDTKIQEKEKEVQELKRIIYNGHAKAHKNIMEDRKRIEERDTKKRKICP